VLVTHLEKLKVASGLNHLGGEELEAAEVGAARELDTLLATLQPKQIPFGSALGATTALDPRTMSLECSTTSPGRPPKHRRLAQADQRRMSCHFQKPTSLVHLAIFFASAISLSRW
jgi:hypothetical protein